MAVKKEGRSAQKIHIIPKPLSVEQYDGMFCLSPDTKIIINQENEGIDNVPHHLTEIIKNSTGLSIDTSESYSISDSESTFLGPDKKTK